MRIQSTAVAMLVIKDLVFHGCFVKLLVDFWFSLSVRDGLFFNKKLSPSRLHLFTSQRT